MFELNTKEVNMVRLYIPYSLFKNQEITLPENQSHYVQNVMRLKKGDKILIFNGTEGEWEAHITLAHKKSTTLRLTFQVRAQVQEKSLWLLFSPLKSKRQEFLIEKATELGASYLCPLQFERTSVSNVNLRKMRAQVQEAAEQCRRLTVPEILPLTPFPTFLKSWPQTRLLLFGNETLNSPILTSLHIDPQKLYAFLVGPEGGLTQQELALLSAHPQAQGVTLNSHILRTETAALVGVSYLKMKIT